MASSLLRRTLVLGGFAGAGALGPLVLSSSSSAAAGSKVTQTYGQELGSSIPLQYPTSLGIRHDTNNWVHALILNGNTYGGRTTGISTGEYHLGADDYWSEFEVHSQVFVDYLRFKSIKPITVAGGGLGGKDRTLVKGARITRVGGFTNNIVLTQLVVEYVEDYQSSKLIKGGVKAVFDFTPGGQKTKVYIDRSLDIARVYERITENSLELNINTSAQAEFFAKLSQSTNLTSKSTTREDIKISSEEALKTGWSREDEVPRDMVEFITGTANIMQDTDGHYWVYPTGQKRIKLTREDFRNLVDHYDLTNAVPEQTGLGSQASYGLSKLVPAGSGTPPATTAKKQP